MGGGEGGLSGEGEAVNHMAGGGVEDDSRRRRCSEDIRVSFNSFFAKPRPPVGCLGLVVFIEFGQNKRGARFNF